MKMRTYFIFRTGNSGGYDSHWWYHEDDNSCQNPNHFGCQGKADWVSSFCFKCAMWLNPNLKAHVWMKWVGNRFHISCFFAAKWTSHESFTEHKHNHCRAPSLDYDHASGGFRPKLDCEDHTHYQSRWFEPTENRHPPSRNRRKTNNFQLAGKIIIRLFALGKA